MHATNVKPTILGGVSQGFWSRFLGSGARSPIFCHLKKGTFDKSAHFCVPKMGLKLPESKKPSPNGSYQSILGNPVTYFHRLLVDEYLVIQ